MALKAAPCIIRGCHKPVHKGTGRCTEHQLQAYRSGRKERLPDDWPWRKKITFQEHGDICHVCKEPGADTIDHIIAGDDHSLSNLAPIHDRNFPHCHRYKTSQEGVNARTSDPRPFGQNLINQWSVREGLQ